MKELIFGGLIGILLLWFMTRFGKFSKQIDQDYERMFRKWLREEKKKRDQKDEKKEKERHVD